MILNPLGAHRDSCSAGSISDQMITKMKKHKKRINQILEINNYFVYKLFRAYITKFELYIKTW